jgi:hypothetical protein
MRIHKTFMAVHIQCRTFWISHSVKTVTITNVCVEEVTALFFRVKVTEKVSVRVSI